MTPDQLHSLIRSLEITEAVAADQRPPEAVMSAEALNLKRDAATRGPGGPKGLAPASSLPTAPAPFGRSRLIRGFNDKLFAVSASTTSGHNDDLPTILVVQPVAGAGRATWS